MTNTLYAIKQGMTEAYVGENRAGVTLLKVMPMKVAHHKLLAKDGYDSTQVIFGQARKKTTKAQTGHLRKAKVTGKYIREITGLTELELGSDVIVAPLLAGTHVTITATSKGKGLAGVVKRHHFAGGPRTHGQSDRLRRAGSIGQGTTPGRVYKGKKMSGRMGNDQVTVKTATILSYDPSNQQLVISGPVPGHNGALVKVVLTSDAPKDFPLVTLTKHNIVSPVTTTPEVVVESEAA